MIGKSWPTFRVHPGPGSWKSPVLENNQFPSLYQIIGYPHIRVKIFYYRISKSTGLHIIFSTTIFLVDLFILVLHIVGENFHDTGFNGLFIYRILDS